MSDLFKTEIKNNLYISEFELTQSAIIRFKYTTIRE